MAEEDEEEGDLRRTGRAAVVIGRLVLTAKYKQIPREVEDRIFFITREFGWRYLGVGG